MDFFLHFKQGKDTAAKTAALLEGSQYRGREGVAEGGIWGEEEGGMFSAWEKARSEQVAACMNVQRQRQVETHVPVGAGACLGGCWCCRLDQPEVGRGQAGAAAPNRVRSIILAATWGLGSSSTRRAPGRNNEQMARSGVPGTHLDSPCLQAVGAGQGGGGEEDFRSKLNLLENLACSPSS